MTYINKIDSPVFGEIWYRMYLRNWSVLGESAERNLAHGPLIEIVADKYLLCAAGASPNEAIQNLGKILIWYAEDSERVLPLRIDYPDVTPWYNKLRLRWMMRTWRRTGIVNEVRIPKS